MNSLNLSFFDSVAPFTSGFPVAAETPRVRTRTMAAVAAPASLWQQSFAAHEPAARARWGAWMCYGLLGTVSAVSMAYAAMELFHGVLGQNGLHAAVQTLMTR